MSLFGALSIGQSSLATQQIALQVTGNNIANANTPGYTRQSAQLASSGTTQVAPGQYVGAGVMVSSISRQINEAVETSLRDATSSLQDSTTQDSFLGRVETTFNAVGDQNLSTRLSDFFNNFTALAANPQDNGQRTIVLQGGTRLANYVQGLQSQLVSIRNDADTQIQQLGTQTNTLLQNIANLNQQIIRTQGGGGGANDLLDQRNADLTSLAKLMNITTVDQGNGMLNVYAGSMNLVQGTDATALITQPGSDPTGKLKITSIVTADRTVPVPITGGQLGALITSRDAHVGTALTTLNTIASALINTVNSIHSQGQGTEGFSTLTGTTTVSDPTLPLNAPLATTGLPSLPVNGTFSINVQNLTTGSITTRQIKIDSSVPTTLNSLVSSLNSAGVQATVDSSGHLNIQSTSPNNTFSFSDDTSGVLAALGVNTFFAGSDASTISINQMLVDNPAFVAAARASTAGPGSNVNANAIASAYVATSSQLGGQSLQDFYTNYIGQLATTAQAAHEDSQAQSTIHDTIFAQREAISGVSMDEEAINLTKYQRAFEGSARFISIVDQMMQTVLGLVH